MTGDVINLATFNLDTAALVKSLDQLQNVYFDLRKEQKEYTDKSKEAANKIRLLTKENKLLADSKKDESARIAENNKTMQDLVKTQKELFKSEQNLGIQIGTVKKEINQTTTQLRAYQDAESKTKSLIDLGNDALGRQIKNKNEARAANIALNNVANQLNPNIKEEADLLVKLNKKMDENTKFIKDNSSETAKQKMNVGNYASALQGLDGILAKFGINGQQARSVVSGFTSVVSKAGGDIANFTQKTTSAVSSTLGFKTAAQQASEMQNAQTISTNAQSRATETLSSTTVASTVATKGSTIGLRAFSIALATTGIGLVVLGVLALKAAFTSSEEGQNKFIKILGVIGALTGNIIDLLSGIGEKIINVFENPKTAIKSFGESLKQNIINRFIGLAELIPNIGKAIKLLLSGEFSKAGEIMVNSTAKIVTGVDNVTGKIKKAGKAVSDYAAEQKKEAKLAAQVADMRANADKIDRKLIVDRSKLESQIAEKRRDAADKDNFSAEQRKVFLKDVQKLEDSLLSKEQESLNLKFEAIKIENTFSRTNKENLTKEAEAESALSKLKTKRYDEQRTTLRLLSKVDKEVQAEKDASQKKDVERNKEAIDNALAKSKAEIDLFVAEQGFKRKSTQEQYDFNNALLKKESDDLKLQLKNNKISQIEYDAQLLDLKNQTLSANADLVIENANLEIDAQIAKNSLILANDQYLSDEQLRIKQETLAANLLAETTYQELLLENGKINQAEFNAAINQINEENRLANLELVAVNKAAEQEKALIDLENSKIIQEENFLAQAELDKERNAIKLEQELANAEKTGADVQLIKDKYAQMDKDIDESVNANKLNLASQTFGNLASIFGENSKEGKAMAIAQTTIDTYQSAIAAYKSLAGIPIVGPALGGIAAAAATVSGFQAVKKITATKQPTFKKASYASGVIGLRGAGDGTSDNIQAKLSVGESVINAKGTSMFANELDVINKIGNGKGLNGASNILNQNEIKNNVNNSQMAQMIAEAVAIGSELGTSKGSQKGIIGLSDNRKIMNDAKF